jgi:hypothetical protein
MSKSSASRLTASQKRAALATLTNQQLLERMRAVIAECGTVSEKKHRRILYLVMVSRKEGR